MKKLFLALIISAAAVLSAAEYKLVFSTDKPEAVYKSGEPIVMSAQLLADGKPAAGCRISYRHFINGKAVKNGRHTVGAAPLSVRTSLNAPGWTHINCKAFDKAGKPIRVKVMVKGSPAIRQLSGGIGAMTDPEKLNAVYPEPEDFDAFWDNLRKITLTPPIRVLEKVDVTPANRRENFVVYDVKVECAGVAPVSGYLIIPKNAKANSLPAIVQYHGAGFRSSKMPFHYAELGMIVFDVNAHGILNGQSKAYYDKVRAEIAKRCGGRYNHSFKDNRDKYYYKAVYMRVMRSLQYVKSLPEWDGKHLIVTGGSQGGAQVIAACALDKDITFARALVPAMSDHSGSLAGRQSGWPRLYMPDSKGNPENPAVARAVAYYDNCYFARRIKCPIYVCTGFIDTVCSPTSVFAFYNNLPKNTRKSMCITPTGFHNSPDRYFPAAFDAYVKQIKKENSK